MLIVFIQWMGASLGLPLFPLFLRHRGGTPTMIGLIMASFFVAGLCTQFAIGHLSDRFGRRPILIIGLLSFGLASFFYALPLRADWFIVARVVQGASAGAIEVASLAAVASLFDESERGRAISRIFAAQLFGFAMGPLAGSTIGVNQLQWAFMATGIASCLASFRALRSDLGDRAQNDSVLPPIQWSSRIIGSLVAACAGGLMVGVYESCWSLLMTNHHASTFQIRLSWTFFCLPWVVLSPLGGYLADHANRKMVAIAGTVNGAVFMAIYPHIHNNHVLLFLGALESVGTSLSMPSISSLLTQGAVDREFGRRQGLSTTSNTAALAGSAAISGTLFSVNPALPFTVVAICSMTLALSLPWWWRHAHGRSAHKVVV